MSNILPLPQETANTILAAMANIGLTPVINESRGLAYQLPYQSGLVLTVVFLCAYGRCHWRLCRRKFMPRSVTYFSRITGSH